MAKGQTKRLKSTRNDKKKHNRTDTVVGAERENRNHQRKRIGLGGRSLSTSHGVMAPAGE